MKKLFLASLSILSIASMSAQTFVNKGATVAVTQGAVMIVKADNAVTNSGTLENDATTTGIFKNKGQVTIEGDFKNTSGVADGYAANTGEYRVQKNWVNNATFNADQSTVTLYGANQFIDGSNVTTFYNLTCLTDGSVKEQRLDAKVAGTLNLKDKVELATKDHNMTILNTDPAAIVRTNLDEAFVSSTGVGRLVRNTDQKVEYIFPTGVNNGGSGKVREVSIVPANSQARSYEVRFADNAPATNTTTADNFDTAKKSFGISEVNDVYYHLISASDNAPADLSVHFNPFTDKNWKSLGRWENLTASIGYQWEDLQNGVMSSGLSNRTKMTKSAWIPTSDQAHALINPVDVTKDFAFPNAFIPFGQYSGTGSGSHDPTKFTIINDGDLVTLEELSVFNRWGEMVYNNQRDGVNSWDGVYQGKQQQQSNYVYLAKVRNKSTGKLYPTVTGNLSLIW